MKSRFFSGISILIVLLFVSLLKPVKAQEIYVHVSNTDLYEFIDELTNAGLIEVNTAVKPYSRIFIARQLQEADRQREQLNKRQQAELDFYRKDFRKELEADKNFDRRRDLFYYKDSLFTFTVNPIFGVTVFNNDSGTIYKRWNGAEAWATVGKNFGFYASLRDNHESKRLGDPEYLNQYNASNYKVNTEGGGDFDEVRGGMTYAWKWGSVGLVKDHFVWGDNYNGANIFSGHVPSFTYLTLHLQPVRWFDFNYIHGWLVSDVIDSTRTYSIGLSNRIHFHPKFVAANLFTFRPWKQFQASIGNSIVYSDQNVHPAYLIPFFFYKTIDHSLTSAGSNFLGQNSQLFFNISSRNIKNVHLYTSLFVDEIALNRAFNKDRHSNFISLKAGVRMSNLFVSDLFLTAEYTRTHPIVYRHYLTTADFKSNSYNLGHYLGDNAQEIYLAAGYKPLARLKIEISYTLAQKGAEYPYTGISYDPLGNGLGKPFLDRVYWKNTDLGFKARYQVINDAWVFAGINQTESSGINAQRYTMPNFTGKQTTFQVGANIGF